MQSVAVFVHGLLGQQPVGTIGFGDGDGVGHFHDAFFDTLQLVARARQHEEQEEVRHPAHQRLGLAHAHGFYENDFVARCLAEQHRLAGAVRHAAQRIARRRRPDVGQRMVDERLHTRFVAQNAAARPLATGIDRQNGQRFAQQNEVPPESLDEGTFTHTRYARDADTERAARAWQHAIQHPLRQLTVSG